MTAGSASRVLRVPGRLVIDPTDLTDDFPHGGTLVGRTRLVVLKPLANPFRVESEGLGGDASDVLEGSNHYVFACFLRGWDDDAVALLLPDGYTQGSVTGHAVFSSPGLNAPGRSALGRARTLLYVPDNPVDAPAVLIHRGVANWGDGAELALQRQTELGLPLVVECVRAADGRILDLGRLPDLTL